MAGVTKLRSQARSQRSVKRGRSPRRLIAPLHRSSCCFSPQTSRRFDFRMNIARVSLSRLADDLTLVEDRLRNAVLRPAQVEQLERFPNPLKFPNVRDDSRRPVMRG